MKFPLLLVFLSGVALGSPWPMPATMPEPRPAGTAASVYPAPRIEWLQRVKSNNDAAHKIADQIELVFDGDSITDWWQRGGKAIWDARYQKLQAFDFGIAGDRTEHLLWRLSQGQVDGLHPKLIALMIGTNNLSSNTPEEIAEGVKAIVEDYRKRCPDAVILLQAIFPRGELPTDPSRAKIKAINEIISKLGDDQKVVYVDFGGKFLDAEGKLPKDVMPDSLHPSAKGYQIWADAIQPIIDRYFPKR